MVFLFSSATSLATGREKNQQTELYSSFHLYIILSVATRVYPEDLCSMHVLYGLIKISCLFNLMRILYGLIKGGLLFNCMHVLLSHTGWVLCVEQKYDWPMEGFLLAFAPPLSVTRKGAGSSGKSTSEQQNSFLATFLESVIRVKGFDLESRIQNTLFLPLWEITIDGIKGA